MTVPLKFYWFSEIMVGTERKEEYRKGVGCENKRLLETAQGVMKITSRLLLVISKPKAKYRR